MRNPRIWSLAYGGGGMTERDDDATVGWPTRSRAVLVGALFCVALGLNFLPLLSARVPPLNDYPFHAARSWILATLGTTQFTRDHYQFTTYLLPDVGMDIVMRGLTSLMPVMIAGRVLIGFIMTLIMSGVLALHFALYRRLSIWPLLSAFFLYNFILFFGFMNYLVGVGVMLWAAAIWVGCAQWAPPLRSAIGAGLAILLLFSHLESFGLFALVAAGFELYHAWEIGLANRAAIVRRLAWMALPFVITLLVFVGVSPTAGEANRSVEYYGWWGWKPLVAFRSLRTSVPWLDALTLGPLAVACGVMLARGRVGIAVRAVPSVLLLVVAFIVMPYGLFGSLYADARIPVAIMFVLIAVTNCAPGQAACDRALIIGALSLLAVRSVVLTWDWMRSDRVIAQFQDAFDRIPDGAVLWVVRTAQNPSLAWKNGAELDYWRPPTKHLVSLAAIGRSIFVPSTWADPAKQPITLTPAYSNTGGLQTAGPPLVTTADDLDRWIHRMKQAVPDPRVPHYLVLLSPDGLKGGLPASVELVSHAQTFDLLRLP